MKEKFYESYFIFFQNTIWQLPAGTSVSNLQKFCFLFSDIDDCVGNPCGEYGTCVDEVGNFSCLCDEPWSGDTCQVAPEFCLNHKCKNGGKCVNQPEYKNYSCACAEGYAGALCERLVGNYIISVLLIVFNIYSKYPET